MATATATATVEAISTTAVKGLAMQARDEVELGPLGVVDNRCFFVIDERDTLVNGKRVGELAAVHADYDIAGARLSLRFPDGTTLSETVSGDGAIATRFFSRTPQATPVCPQLSEALSAFSGRPLRIVRADPALTASDRGPGGVVSLLSRGSLEHLSGLAGGPVDARRFRMLFEISGLPAHGEDAYVDETVAIGEALVRFSGHVGRCRVTTMDPDTGTVDLPTLDLLGYRKGLETTEPLAFGIYGEVLVPGRVRVGDPVIVTAARSQVPG